jgi:hypothetical protein
MATHDALARANPMVGNKAPCDIACA